MLDVVKGNIAIECSVLCVLLIFHFEHADNDLNDDNYLKTISFKEAKI